MRCQKHRYIRLVACDRAVKALGALGDWRALGGGWHVCPEPAADAVRVGAALAGAWAGGGSCGGSARARPRAVFFDMDATAIAEESIVVLADRCGRREEVARITEAAMRGELDFGAALKARVRLLAGMPAEVLGEVYRTLTVNQGLETVVRRGGFPCFLVSGGFTALAGPLAERLGFAGVHANTLGIRDGRLTGDVLGTIVDAAGKREFLLATCRRLGIAPEDAVAVGDGANDLPMLGAAGVAVGLRPKDVLLPHLDAVNRAGDHSFLGPLLTGGAL